MPIIKRYNNRKLYDTHGKRYVTLLDLAEMIRRGDDVTVLDHATGADITSQVQAQIIFEQERQTGSGLPNTVLTNLIQASNQTIRQLRTTLLPLNWTARIDSEIERRIETLVEQGELSPRQGQKLAGKLLTVHPLPHSAEQLRLERALERRGTPTRSDVKLLAEQIERLAREVESLPVQPARKKRKKNNSPS